MKDNNAMVKLFIISILHATLCGCSSPEINEVKRISGHDQQGNISEVKADNTPNRYENGNDRAYYWIEAESLVPSDANYGRWKYRNRWTRKKNGLPNDSKEYSLVSPENKSAASISSSTIITKPGTYNLWLRIGVFSPWGKQGITLNVNGKDYRIIPDEGSQVIEKAFSWININPAGIELTSELKLRISNNIYQKNIAVLDCFLLTNDLQYRPPLEIPRWGYFTANPYNGPVAEADLWHPSKLDIPAYICANSAQHLLLRIRNYRDHELKNFKVSITLPEGLELLNPAREKRWAGDNELFKNPPFISASPTSITLKKSSQNGKNVNEYQLYYRDGILPYNIYNKVSSLTFIVLKAKSGMDCSGRYQISMQVLDSEDKEKGTKTIQELVVLPALSGKPSTCYKWGVDAIYFSFLSNAEQQLLLRSFEDAGINIWASRVRENAPLLSMRNRNSWHLLNGFKNLELVNWGEWFWPGSPYTNESLEYVKKHPAALGKYRNDDRGKSLKDKLICPTYLIKDPEESYLEEHMKKITDILKTNQITEYIEDAEYSSPLSFCFCERCKKEFSSFCNIPYTKMESISPDEIIDKYKNQWINFRTIQNTKILGKISSISHRLYPDIKFNVFCGYQSFAVKQRYGIDWPSILTLPYIDGVYIGGGMPGTASQILQMQKWCQSNKKTFISMANATLSFPHGYDELSFRNPAYLESRIIHDIMCGSGGIFIWWWGTLDGRCLKAFETGSRLAAEYGDIMRNGTREQKAGTTEDFVLLTAETSKGKLICLSNPSRFSEDKVSLPSAIMREFSKDGKALNLLTGKEESYNQVKSRIDAIYHQGEVSLWLVK